jgi:hypothetical protein
VPHQSPSTRCGRTAATVTRDPAASCFCHGLDLHRQVTLGTLLWPWKEPQRPPPTIALPTVNRGRIAFSRRQPRPAHCLVDGGSPGSLSDPGSIFRSLSCPKINGRWVKTQSDSLPPPKQSRHHPVMSQTPAGAEDGQDVVSLVTFCHAPPTNPRCRKDAAKRRRRAQEGTDAFICHSKSINAFIWHSQSVRPRRSVMLRPRPGIDFPRPTNRNSTVRVQGPGIGGPGYTGPGPAI